MCVRSKHSECRSQRRLRLLLAFTLIELLVVVTIIVVLLALLVPAMDRAVYQAELAACGANQKAVALGITSYAMENDRFYPYRPTTIGRPIYVFTIAFDWVDAEPARDDRPYLRSHMSLNALVDPLAGGIDVDSPPAEGSWIMANYSLWFGVQFFPGLGGGKRMTRIGDRLEWTDKSGGEERMMRSSILLSDYDAVYGGQSEASSHPETQQKLLSFLKYQERSSGQHIQTFSWWIGPGNGTVEGQRNPLDLNYAYADGSVRRLNGVKMREERMIRVPLFNGGSGTFEAGASFWHQLPPQ